MTRFAIPLARMACLAVLAIAPTTAMAAASAAQEHAPMLIDKIPADLWPGQRDVRPTDYPKEQGFLRDDVARYLKGRFRIIGDRLFVIPPDGRIILGDGPFLLGGPGQFQKISSVPAFDDRPLVRYIRDARTGPEFNNTSITLGVTQSGEKVYTAITLHGIPNSDDQLIGYHQLEPLIPDPAKGL